MTLLPALRITLPAALLALLTACGGGDGASEESGPPPPTPAASLTLAPASGSVSAGASTTTTVTLTRGGGFTGAVTIAATGAPAGVTVTGGTIAAGADTQVVSIATTGSTAAGAVMLSITGAGAGVTITPVNYALTVTAPVPTAASVTVSKPEGALLFEGGNITLTATLRDADGNVITGPGVTWTSSNNSLATVSSAGVVTAGTPSGAPGAPVTITATSGTASGQIALPLVQDISSFVSQIRTDKGLPAMGGAVVTRDGIIAIGVAGNRSISSGVPVTLNDKWHIGSNLKALTAALAAIAVQEGKISWDTTVVSGFPELAGSIRAEYTTVTLRDLLAMRSGLQGNPPSNSYSPGGSTARGQREWGAGWALSQAPAVPKGSYFYSNLAYVTAGAMIERALNGTFEDLLVTRLAQPAGANGVGWGPQDTAGANPAGHTRSGGSWAVCNNCDNPPGLSAAGRAHMPLADWGRIISEVLKADAGQSSVLTTNAIRETLIAQTTGTGGDPYGLGWIVTTRPWGGRVVQHTGSNNTNHSVAWVGLDTGVAFIALTNAADHSGTATSTGAALDALVVRELNWYQTGN